MRRLGSSLLLLLCVCYLVHFTRSNDHLGDKTVAPPITNSTVSPKQETMSINPITTTSSSMNALREGHSRGAIGDLMNPKLAPKGVQVQMLNTPTQSPTSGIVGFVNYVMNGGPLRSSPSGSDSSIIMNTTSAAGDSTESFEAAKNAIIHRHRSGVRGAQGSEQRPQQQVAQQQRNSNDNNGWFTGWGNWGWGSGGTTQQQAQQGISQQYWSYNQMFQEHQLLAQTPAKCCLNNVEQRVKKMIVDVDEGGLGSRLLGIASAALMAMATDRVLYLQWSQSMTMASSFSELFQVDDAMMSYGVFYPENRSTGDPNLHGCPPVVQKECKLDFSQRLKYTHFHTLMDKRLTTRLDEQCDVLYITTNQYFAPLLFENPVYGPKLLKLFPHRNPFPEVSSCAFRTRQDIVDSVKPYLEQINGVGQLDHKPWISLHVRGLYDTGKGLLKSLECVDKMITLNLIKYVFFATESQELLNLVKSVVPSQYLVTTNKTLLVPAGLSADQEGVYMRHEMRDAMQEWYLLGHSDYCMSSTMEKSAFSQTSFSHGTCRYLDGLSCSLDRATKDKDIISTAHQKIMPSYRKGKGLQSDARERYWESIPKYESMRSYPCHTSAEHSVEQIGSNPGYLSGIIELFWTRHLTASNLKACSIAYTAEGGDLTKSEFSDSGDVTSADLG